MLCRFLKGADIMAEKAKKKFSLLRVLLAVIIGILAIMTEDGTYSIFA